MLSPYFDIFNMESLYFISYKSKKCQCAPTDHLQEQIKIQAWFSLLCKHIYIYIIYCARDRGVFSPARPITHTGRLLHRPKKKSTYYLHWWITRTLCYSTFWWQKRDIKVIHFSLLKVVWSNFWKRECLFVECKGQRNSDACTILCQY